jgi:hypothetical protein
MINYYFEFSDTVAEKMDINKYVTRRLTPWQNIYHNGYNLGHMANRVWCEDEASVCFVKNRFGGHAADVDLKEFMWIKLKV